MGRTYLVYFVAVMSRLCQGFRCRLSPRPHSVTDKGAPSSQNQASNLSTRPLHRRGVAVRYRMTIPFGCQPSTDPSTTIREPTTKSPWYLPDALTKLSPLYPRRPAYRKFSISIRSAPAEGQVTTSTGSIATQSAATSPRRNRTKTPTIPWFLAWVGYKIPRLPKRYGPRLRHRSPPHRHHANRLPPGRTQGRRPAPTPLPSRRNRSSAPETLGAKSPT